MREYVAWLETMRYPDLGSFRMFPKTLSLDRGLLVLFGWTAIVALKMVVPIVAIQSCCTSP